MSRHILYCVLCALLLSFFSCHSDHEESVVLPVQEEKKPEVTLMFSTGGLGDDGYNDLILKGAQQVAMSQNNLDVFFISPDSTEEAECAFKDWLQKAEGTRKLFVLASNEYEKLVIKYSNEIVALPGNKKILLFESENTSLPVTTFLISSYGASFLAGKSVAHMGCEAPLIILGNSLDSTLTRAVEGFKLGYGAEVNTEALADDWQGYIMHTELYKRMSSYAEAYDYFFSLAGGSNKGIYQYMREHPKGRGWTAGMDVDQHTLTIKINGSLLKHIDVLIKEYLQCWIESREMPKHCIYGLESGHSEWKIAPLYEYYLDDLVETNKAEAILKEREYENK